MEFEDVHGLTLAMVESDKTAESKNILGFHGVTMLSADPEMTKALLENELGLEKVSASEKNVHYQTVGDVHHQVIVEQFVSPRNVRWGTGIFHHIAWSVPDDETQLEWRDHLTQQGYVLTEVKERFYFHAVYMKEKGNLIFEFATQGPGFMVDESIDELGQSLKLPPFYETQRYEIESKLTPLTIQ